MIIDCISDLHGDYPKDLSGGDLLIIAGDITASDLSSQYLRFFSWLDKQDYEKKILVGGNHDGLFAEIAPDFGHWNYLCDSGTKFLGLKIWGSPWTPEFSSWHFMLPRGEKLKEKWDLIPSDTDILVTHGPAFGILDKTDYEERIGCKDLLKAVERVKPKLHVFGHNHGGYGKIERKETIFVNAARMDESYEPVNKPIRVELL